MMIEFPPSLFNQLQLVPGSFPGKYLVDSAAFLILEEKEQELLIMYLDTGSYKAVAMLVDKSELDVYFLLRRAIYKISLFG